MPMMRPADSSRIVPMLAEDNVSPQSRSRSRSHRDGRSSDGSGGSGGGGGLNAMMGGPSAILGALSKLNPGSCSSSAHGGATGEDESGGGGGGGGPRGFLRRRSNDWAAQLEKLGDEMDAITPAGPRNDGGGGGRMSRAAGPSPNQPIIAPLPGRRESNESAAARRQRQRSSSRRGESVGVGVGGRQGSTSWSFLDDDEYEQDMGPTAGGGAAPETHQPQPSASGTQRSTRVKRSSSQGALQRLSSVAALSRSCAALNLECGGDGTEGDAEAGEGGDTSGTALCSKCGGPSSSSSSPQEEFSNDTFPLRKACTISLDLGRPNSGASSSEKIRHHQDLRRKARSLLEEAYGRDVERFDASNYVVLPTAAGLAIVVFRPANGHPSREYTSLWFAARMITWAATEKRSVLRGGLASGTFETVQDVYGMPVVIGPSIGTAMRILDCSLPGQVLACADSVVPELELEINLRAAHLADHADDERLHPVKHHTLSYVIDDESHEVIANDNSTAKVQALTGTITKTDYGGGDGSAEAELEFRARDPPIPFGNRYVPENKWYLRLKPAELTYDESTGGKAKIPPADLLRKHSRVAFVGVTHSQIAGVLRKVLDVDRTKTWDRMYFLFLTDDRLEWAADDFCSGGGGDDDGDVTSSDLIRQKVQTVRHLKSLLSNHVRDLRFLEYDRPYYCASYWDWDERGGFIHVSPFVWGADIRACPAMNYYWIATDPGDDYVSYQDGLTSLLQTSERIEAASNAAAAEVSKDKGSASASASGGNLVASPAGEEGGTESYDEL